MGGAEPLPLLSLFQGDTLSCASVHLPDSSSSSPLPPPTVRRHQRFYSFFFLFSETHDANRASADVVCSPSFPTYVRLCMHTCKHMPPPHPTHTHTPPAPNKWQDFFFANSGVWPSGRDTLGSSLISEGRFWGGGWGWG